MGSVSKFRAAYYAWCGKCVLASDAKSAYKDLSYGGFARVPELGWSITATSCEDKLRRSALLTRSPNAAEGLEVLRIREEISRPRISIPRARNGPTNLVGPSMCSLRSL